MIQKLNKSYIANKMGYWLVGVSSLVFIAYEYLCYRSLRFPMLDLGLFNRHMYSLARLDFSINPLKGINLLGDHAHYFLIPLAPFYALWQSPVFLLVVQALAISFSAYPIYLIAKHYFNSDKIALLWAVIYLSFFGFWAALSYPFHDSPVAVLPIAWALYYLVVNKNYRRLAIWLVILCLIREDMALVATMFGVYTTLFDKKYRFGGVVIAASLAYFLVVTRVLLPAMGTGTYLYGDNPFGSSFADIIKATFTQPHNVIKEFFLPKAKLQTILYMLFSFGGLPLLAPRLLILLIPLWMGRTFTTQSWRWLPIQHYSASQAPILCVAAIVGLAFLCNYYVKNNKTKHFIISLSIVSLIFSLGVTYVTRSYYFGRFFISNMYIDNAAQASARAGMGLIPSTASVGASSSFAGLSTRQNVYNLPLPDETIKPQYIIASSELDIWPFASKQELNNYLEELIGNNQYEIIFNQNGTQVLINKNPS